MGYRSNTRCYYCDRLISSSNSPSQFDVYGNWTDEKRYPPICDECMERLTENK